MLVSGAAVHRKEKLATDLRRFQSRKHAQSRVMGCARHISLVTATLHQQLMCSIMILYRGALPVPQESNRP